MFDATVHVEGLDMRAVPIAVSDDLAVKIDGRRMLSLSPGEPFDFAKALIRNATRAIVIEEADRAES